MMGFGDFLGLVAAMGGLVAIIGILSNTYRRRLEHKERIAELRSGSGAATASPDSDAIIARLENRVRVLERIATDKSADIASQIEDLREPADAR
jgi:hypothetical protein